MIKKINIKDRELFFRILIGLALFTLISTVVIAIPASLPIQGKLTDVSD